MTHIKTPAELAQEAAVQAQHQHPAQPAHDARTEALKAEAADAENKRRLATDATTAGKPLVVPKGKTTEEHLAETLKLHQAEADKAAARPLTKEEIEADELAARTAPGVAQREAERLAMLAAQTRADVAAGVFGVDPIGHQRYNQPGLTAHHGEFNTGDRKGYTALQDISYTVDGRTIVAKKGAKVNLTAAEAAALPGAVK